MCRGASHCAPPWVLPTPPWLAQEGLALWVPPHSPALHSWGPVCPRHGSLPAAPAILLWVSSPQTRKPFPCAGLWGDPVRVQRSWVLVGSRGFSELWGELGRLPVGLEVPLGRGEIGSSGGGRGQGCVLTWERGRRQVRAPLSRLPGSPHLASLACRQFQKSRFPATPSEKPPRATLGHVFLLQLLADPLPCPQPQGKGLEEEDRASWGQLWVEWGHRSGLGVGRDPTCNAGLSLCPPSPAPGAWAWLGLGAECRWAWGSCGHPPRPHVPV